MIRLGRNGVEHQTSSTTKAEGLTHTFKRANQWLVHIMEYNGIFVAVQVFKRCNKSKEKKVAKKLTARRFERIWRLSISFRDGMLQIQISFLSLRGKKRVDRMHRWIQRLCSTCLTRRGHYYS